MLERDIKVIIPGAAGLVGQNLIVLLKQQGYSNIVALDKHPDNTALLRKLHPDINVVEADVSVPGDWQKQCEGGDVLIMLQAQIGSKHSAPFVANNITSTRIMLDTSKDLGIKKIIHASSSVVESVADDDYTETKKQQEEMVKQSGIDYCILRPTLMFGWFDRKHLGWLSRFMHRVPIFPIPGHGRYMRQPLYVGDFCRIIASCVTDFPINKVFNITGREHVNYVDMIRTIRDTIGAKTWIVHIPYWLFWLLLKINAVFDSDPPFTASQLKALVAGDEFEVIPWWEIFNVKPTPFKQAVEETFTHAEFSQYELKF